MSRFSLKNLVQEDMNKPVEKLSAGWQPIVQESKQEKIVENITAKPRAGLKSLMEVQTELQSFKKEPVNELVQSFTAQIEKQEENRTNRLAESVIETITEVQIEPITKTIKEETLIDKASAYITTHLKSEDSFQQPVAITPSNFGEVARKVKFLEEWISKVSTAGPGSGSYFLYDMGDTNYDLVKHPSDNDVLVYNSANAKWEVATVESLTSLFTASYFSNVNQTANVSTPRYVTFNNVDFENGFTNDGSNIISSFSGIYNLEFSLQLHHSAGGGAGTNFELWLEKNGVDQPFTNTVVHVSSNNPYHVAAWNFLVDLNAGDKIALNWGVDNDKIILEAGGQTIGPSVPSAIITITSG